VVFSVPEGDVVVMLPDDLAAGDTISGAVVAAPAGKGRKRRKMADRLEGYVVAAEEMKAPVGKGALKWTVPAALAGGTATLILLDEKGNAAARTEVPVAAAPPPAAVAEPLPEDFALPEIGQAGRPISIGGPFDGEFGTTAVKMGGETIPLLAESPRKVVVRTPRDVVGGTELEVREGDVVAKGTIYNVGVSLSAPRTKLHQGEETTLQLTVEGLAGYGRPLDVYVRNETPEVVSMEGGNLITVRINPDDLDEEGLFTATIPVRAVRMGSFSISAVVAAASDRHDYSTTRRWKSVNHDLAASSRWKKRHNESVSVAEKLPERHAEELSEKWVGRKHSLSTSRKWRAEGHALALTERWGKHAYARSRQWSHSNHAVEASRRWKDDGHAHGTSRLWRGEGHAYEQSTAWARLKPKHSYVTSKHWKGYGHKEADSWKWRAEKHQPGISIKRVGKHEADTTKMWKGDLHREKLSRRWRGEEHRYTTSMKWKDERHNHRFSRRWKGEGHNYGESRKWQGKR